MKIYTKILLGLVLGALVGLGLGYLEAGYPSLVARVQSVLDPVGQTFVRLICMVIVPLVFASLTLGIASLGGDLRKLGRLGAKTLAFFMLTTMLSIALGLALSELVQPGAGIDEEGRARLKAAAGAERLAALDNEDQAKRTSVYEMLTQVVPVNPVRSLAYGDMLQIIFFALFLGVAVTMLPPEKGRPILSLLDSINEAMILGVGLVMKLAPYGVFALIAVVVSRFGYGILTLLLKYSAVVVVGQVIILLVIQTGAVVLLARMSPVRFLRGIREAMLVAFSTSSSNATLPVTMQCCEQNLGISNEVTSFVAPLGATINMNGTALYQGVAACFIAQVYQHPLTLGDQVSIVVAATLAAVGTAGVPGVGVVTLAMVLRSVGLPVQGIALILGVDRLLDMVRTVTNITGDCACAAVVAASEGELRTPRHGA